MAMTLITTNTSSNAASSSFTSSIDSTYKLYVFKFIDLNPVTDDVLFQFQVNATDGADYNDSQITSTFFLSSHTESDSDASLSYVTGADQALGTAFQRLCKIGNGSDESAAEYFGYHVQTDLAQSTGYQILGRDLGSDSSESLCGVLHIFSPSSTTYVKHFYAETIFFNDYGGEASMHFFLAGYMNTTSAVDAINFNMASGNMDGVIQMYGIS
jgi:hypothetical protein